MDLKYIKLPVYFLFLGYLAGVMHIHRFDPLSFGYATSTIIALLWLTASFVSILILKNKEK